MDDAELPRYTDLLNICLETRDLSEAKRGICLLAEAFRKDGTRITRPWASACRGRKRNRPEGDHHLNHLDEVNRARSRKSTPSSRRPLTHAVQCHQSRRRCARNRDWRPDALK